MYDAAVVKSETKRGARSFERRSMRRKYLREASQSQHELDPRNVTASDRRPLTRSIRDDRTHVLSCVSLAPSP